LACLPSDLLVSILKFIDRLSTVPRILQVSREFKSHRNVLLNAVLRSTGSHALYCAARSGKRASVETMLAIVRQWAHAEVNSLDIDPAFRIACENGHADIAALILNEGHATFSLSPEVLDSAFTAGCEHGRSGVVQLLLHDGRVDPGRSENNALALASQNGHVAIVRELLANRRCDPSFRSDCVMASHGLRFGLDVALRLGSMKGQAEAVAVLLQDGRADPAAVNQRALLLASYYGHDAVLQVLLRDARCDPRADNDAALGLASKNGHLESVRVLLTDGRCDPTARDCAAVKLASKNHHSSVVHLLLQDPRLAMLQGDIS
jgi:ankyrin repeat protein